MAQKERENFYRNSTVIVDHGKESLSAVLENDLSNTNLTFEDFINKHQHEIYHLCYNRMPCCQCPNVRFVPANQNRVLYPDQLDILLETSGSTLPGHNHNQSRPSQHCCRPAKQHLSISNLDITLLRCLLMNFAQNCQSNHILRQDVEDLVKCRNKLYGHAQEARLTEPDYTKYKTDVEVIILRIAQFCNIETEMRQKLIDASQRPLDETILEKYKIALIHQNLYEKNIEEKFDELKQHLTAKDESLHCRMDTFERKVNKVDLLMAQKERENFYRNSTVIVDHGKESLSAVLENDLSNTNLTFEDFINKHQHEIYHLCYNRMPCCQCPNVRFVPANQNRVLYPDQLDILLETSGSTLPGHNHNQSRPSQHCCRPAKQHLSISNLDITLLRCLLMNFAQNCQSNHILRQDVEDLVKCRNKLYGHAQEARLTEPDYTKYKTDVEVIILRIAQFCNIETEMRQKLIDASQRPLDETILEKYKIALIHQNLYEKNIEEKFDELKQHLTAKDESLHCRMDTFERKVNKVDLLMAQKERENFYRNSTVIVDHGKESLSAVLENDLSNTNLTFEDFINKHQHEIYHLCYNRMPCCQCPNVRFVPANQNRVLYPDQLDILLETSGSTLPGHNHNQSRPSQHCCRPAKQHLSISNLDITLLRCLLMNFAQNCRSNYILRQDVEDLVKCRNKLYGHAQEARLTESDYTKYKTDVEVIILRIAQFCNIETEMRQKLMDASQRPLDETILEKYKIALIHQNLYEKNIEEKFDELKQHLTAKDESLHYRMDTFERKVNKVGQRDTNIIAQTEALLLEHSKNDTYVITEDVKQCCKILEKCNAIVIFAKAGGGKSKTSLQIAMVYQDKSYTPMLLVNDELARQRDRINFNEQNIVIVEDLFGRSNINFNEDLHRGVLDVLYSCIKSESCKTKVILTIRGDEEMNRKLMEKHKIFEKDVLINLEKIRSWHSNTLILSEHMTKHGISLCECKQFNIKCVPPAVLRQCTLDVFETDDSSLKICLSFFYDVCCGKYERILFQSCE